MFIDTFIATGKSEGWLRDTGNSDVKFINGSSQNCPIYEVRVDKLHYNVQNGRIATFISRYEAEHGELPSDQDALDDLIEKMIEEDNPKHLKVTKLDIKTKGQQRAAIILSNGTVIDGNRRFTCLRQLSREEHQNRMVRCFVFPDTYDSNAIKGLELEIQLGEDEKEGYDPIARLVDIDRWVNEGSMTEEEYAKHANFKKGEMKKYQDQIAVMKDFLEFVGAPGAFHIAQDFKLQGAIESLAGRLSKVKNADDRMDIENVVFANLVSGSLGDRARVVRDMVDNLIEDNSYLDEQLGLAEQVLDKFEELPEGTVVTTELLRDQIGADDVLRGDFRASQEKAKTKAGNRKFKNGQVRAVRDAISDIQGVDTAVLGKLEDAQLQEMVKDVADLLKIVADLKVALDDAQLKRAASEGVE